MIQFLKDVQMFYIFQKSPKTTFFFVGIYLARRKKIWVENKKKKSIRVGINKHHCTHFVYMDDDMDGVANTKGCFILKTQRKKKRKQKKSTRIHNNNNNMKKCITKDLRI